MTPKRPIRAVAMLSGGLDSTLATVLVQRQGVEVVGVNFSTGFCRADHKRQVRRPDTDVKKLRNEALRTGAEFEVPVHVIDIAAEYLDVLRHPRHGYGRNANPCIDCRAMMMGRAREFMEEIDADFVFTGEVLGQRPKSQTRRAMNIVAEESGLGDRLVRPLSARMLAPTLPEREGWLDRELLLDLTGRDRNPQLRLAREWGLDEVPQPAGGCCVLTDEGYSQRVFDLFAHGRREDLDHGDLLLCKVGRHFRLSANAKLVVARFDDENRFLETWHDGRPILRARDHLGPVAVLDVAPGAADDPFDLERAAGIVARYSKGKHADRVAVAVERGDTITTLDVRPFAPVEVEAWMLR